MSSIIKKINACLALMGPYLAGVGIWLTICFTQSALANINVVTSIKPVHSLVAGVMQGAGSPTLLLSAGSPHTYALKPSNARALQNADLVIWIGPQIESFLREPLKSLASKAVTLTLVNAPDLSLHNARNDHHQHEGHSIRGHQMTDPHIWLDPLNAKAFVVAINKALKNLDPTNAALYDRNTSKLITRLEELNKQLSLQLTPVESKPFLTFHDAYQYFEKRYRLNMRGSLAISPEKQPGVRHLKELRKRITALGITCVFAEPQFRPKLIDIVIEGTSARSAILDPLGAGIKKGPELYFSMMKNNARAFVSCLDN